MTEADFRVSIVVTSYNQRAYLVEAVESVLQQTLMPHEIIIADDGSSDGSRDTIHDYERRFPGLVRGVLQERNVGIPRNRNAGLRAVTGNYVGILDGDDCFLPRKLEQQVEALRSNPGTKVAYGNFRIVDSQRNPVRVKWNRPQPSGSVFPEIAQCKMGMLRTVIADYRSVAEAGFMDDRFVRYDGLWLTIKLAATCRLAYVDDVVVEKRDHPASDSKTITEREHLQELSGIYRELLPLVHLHANDEEGHRIRASWQRLLQPRASAKE